MNRNFFRPTWVTRHVLASSGAGGGPVLPADPAWLHTSLCRLSAAEIHRLFSSVLPLAFFWSLFLCVLLFFPITVTKPIDCLPKLNV